MFEEIEKQRKDFPNITNVQHRFLGKRPLNFYQIIALCVLVIGFIGAILLGNMVPSCSDTNMFAQCNVTEFNISLTLFSWLGVFLFSMFFYSIGHIINVLESIDQKLK